MNRVTADQDRAFVAHWGAATATRVDGGRWPRSGKATTSADAGALTGAVRAAAWGWAQGLCPGVTISLRGAACTADATTTHSEAAHSSKVMARTTSGRKGKMAVFMVVSPEVAWARSGRVASVRPGAHRRIPTEKERFHRPGDVR